MEHTEREIWAGRVLDLTRTAVAYRDIEDATGNLHAALNANVWPAESEDHDTLASAITWMHTETTDAWAKSSPVHWGFYEDHRTTVIAHAQRLADLAAAAESAANHIVDLLQNADPFDTADRLADLISRARHGDTDIDLADLWHRLGPTDLIDPATANRLRRRFDAEIPHPMTSPALAESVTAWRIAHLAGDAGPLAWDGEAFAYAVGTARSWAELVDLWDRIPIATRDGDMTAAESIQVRDAIADRVRGSGREATVPDRLRELLADYDTNGMALSARIRHATDAPTLERVWEALKRSRDLEHLGMIRALLRRVRDMQTDLGDRWEADLQRLMSELNDWHLNLFQTVSDIAGGRGEHYDTAESYTIISNAIAAAEDTGNTARRQALGTYIDAAHDRHRITDDHRDRLRALYEDPAAALN